MAKFNIEVELDWLAEIITTETESIVSTFLGKTFEQKIESLQIPYKPDKWGSAVEYMPLGEFVGMQYAEHLNKKVFDYQGRTPDRPSEAKISITEYFLKNYLEKELTKKAVRKTIKPIISRRRVPVKESDKGGGAYAAAGLAGDRRARK